MILEDLCLKKFLLDYGIVLDGGIIIDKFSRILGENYMVPVISTYGSIKGLKVLGL
jgi:hypothetical protein